VAVRHDGRHIDRYVLVGAYSSAHGISPDESIQLKLDELLRATIRARTGLVHLKAQSDEQIESLDEEFERLQEKTSPDPKPGR
jgi:Low affinity iron permease